MVHEHYVGNWISTTIDIRGIFHHDHHSPISSSAEYRHLIVYAKWISKILEVASSPLLRKTFPYFTFKLSYFSFELSTRDL